MNGRSVINAIITAAFVGLYLIFLDWLGQLILVALIFLIVLVSCYASGWVVIQIVKEILEHRRQRD